MHLFETFLAEVYGPPGSKALGSGNFQTLWNYYRGRKTTPTLRLEFGNDVVYELTDDDVEKIINYYNDVLQTNDEKRDFVYNTMSRVDKFVRLLNAVGVQKKFYEPQQGVQSRLFEKDKPDNKEVSRDQTRDPKMAAVLSKAYSKFPSARSDIEAFIRQSFDQDETQDQDLDRQDSTNNRQDQLLNRLRNVSQRQSQQLATLDKENNELESEIQDLETQLDKISQRSQGTQTAVQTRKKKKQDKTAEPNKADQDQAQTTAAEPTATKPAKSKKPAAVEPKVDTDIPAYKRAGKTEPEFTAHPTATAVPQSPDPLGATTAMPAKQPDNVIQFPTRVSKSQDAGDQEDLFRAVGEQAKPASLADYMAQARSVAKPKKDKLSHAAAWAKRYPHIHEDLARAQKDGDEDRAKRLAKIKHIIDQGISEQSGLGFGE